MFFKDDNKVKVSSVKISTFIGEDTHIDGTVTCRSSIRVDGTIVGGISAEGTVIISEKGQVQGNVIAENVVVAGIVDGNMQIKDKTNIEPTGEVYGDISTSRILVDEASVFQGKCNMNKDKEVEKKRRRGAGFEVKPISFDNATDEKSVKADAADTKADKQAEKKTESKPEVVAAPSGDSEKTEDNKNYVAPAKPAVPKNGKGTSNRKSGSRNNASKSANV